MGYAAFIKNCRVRLLQIILTIAPALLCQSLAAQNPGSYSVRQYTSDNGLLQNSVHGIEFDKNGYCWLATEMGLVRFDGQNFVHFTQRNLPGLNSNFFTWLSKDAAQTSTQQRPTAIRRK
jgi:ligand-binding sensor domain-containing protein